jgi:hypothetical protein
MFVTQKKFIPKQIAAITINSHILLSKYKIKMKLEVAFEQFLKDLKRFSPNIANSSMASRHYSQKEIVEILNEHFLNKSVECIEFLKIGDLYKKSHDQRRKVINQHIKQISTSFSELEPEVVEEKQLLDTIINNPILFWQQNMHMLPILAKLIVTDEAKDLLNEIVEKYSSTSLDDVPAKMREFVNNEEDFMRVYKYVLQVIDTLKTTLKI